MAIGRLSTNCQSTFDILSFKIYLSEEGFLCFVGKLTYHKCSFTFPLLLIQIRAEKPAFFLFRAINLTAFGRFTKSDATDEFSLSAIAIQKLKLTDVDLEGAVKTRSSSL